jgi:hypothetical protein
MAYQPAPVWPVELARAMCRQVLTLWPGTEIRVVERRHG